MFFCHPPSWHVLYSTTGIIREKASVSWVSCCDTTLVAHPHFPGLSFASTLFKVAFVQNAVCNKYEDFIYNTIISS